MKPYIYLPAFILLLFSATVNAQSESSDTTISFKVAGACGQCKQRIEKSVQLNGVTGANWDLSSGTLTVYYKPAVINDTILHQTLAAAGHDTEKYKATEAAYKSLPECCLYREEAISTMEQFADTSSTVRGVIVENQGGKLVPLQGASILWAGTTQGTVSDIHGSFIIKTNSNTDRLVISYAGFKTDTVSVHSMKDIQLVLDKKETLSGIVVTARARTTYIDANNPYRITVITKKELLKAACCNLSESFETNPAVDVSYNDAATGSKQIQLLGLAGEYTQLTVENLPGPRGMAAPLGLNNIAGPWIESIQLIKGTGSVVNGFESMAGQINVELKKPQTSEKLYLNGYVNSMGKTDINLNLAHKINDKWSAGLLLHNDFLFSKQDVNGDGFKDLPTGNQFNGVQRWQYLGDKGLVSHFGVKFLMDDKVGGQVGFKPSHQPGSGTYRLGINTKRYEVFGKIGYVFPEKMKKSIGLQFSAFDHKQKSYFGYNVYDAFQENVYANFLYQSGVSSDRHQFKTGLSVSSDQYKEILNGVLYRRNEFVPGGFGEYTFHPINLWML